MKTSNKNHVNAPLPPSCMVLCPKESGKHYRKMVNSGLVTVSQHDIETYCAAVYRCRPDARMFRTYFNCYGIYQRVQNAKLWGQWANIEAYANYVRTASYWLH